MSEDEYEIHPLDRDYSQPVSPSRAKPLEVPDRVRRAGVGIFATGFLLLLAAAIVLSNVRGGTLETIGSFTHQISMLLILAGGIVIVVSYRWDQLTKHVPRRKAMQSWRRTKWFMTLAFWNAVGIVVLGFVLHMSRIAMSPTLMSWIFQAVLTITCAVMVTTVVMHQGMLRAYAIGVAVALVMHGYTSMMTLFGFMPIRGQFGGPSSWTFMLSSAAIVVASGLSCAGYACILDYLQERRNQPRTEHQP